ncbi:MAG: c-type cytochrome [Halioglobus sp.]|nr:c-type cytochrome [Halioglobus sp.]
MRLCQWIVVCLCVASASAVASERQEQGREVYVASCARCHEHGAEGAPVTGTAGDWGERSQLWDAVLAEHARDGYLGMPARGGDDVLTEDQVRAATEYIMARTFPHLPLD